MSRDEPVRIVLEREQSHKHGKDLRMGIAIPIPMGSREH